MLVIDDADAAIIGHADVDSVAKVVYDYGKLIEVFVAQGMDEEGAVDWIDFNIIGAHMGPGTPIIMFPGGRAEVDEVADNED